MREGEFELLVIDAHTHEPFPESEIDGIPYIITVPEKEYYVQISIHRGSCQDLWSFNFIRIGLYVDGFDVQYWKRLDLTDPRVKDLTVVHGMILSPPVSSPIDELSL